MDAAIRNLEPQVVWNCFADLNAVPRPSKKEDRVVEFMLAFGKELRLETFKDSVGNVLIRKPATVGMEDRKMVTLQAHLDMVHQKNGGTLFDFENEGIAMYIDGDWVRAHETTLGADNGMGVAAIMALLRSRDIPHPPLEALFTIDEETGMTGALGLEAGLLQGEILLNLDTEEDDEIDIGCAGGLDVTATGSFSEEALPEDMMAYRITLKGLSGGHSGMDIHKGLGNANKIMNRILAMGTENFSARLSSVEGGGLRNAIPRESQAVVAIPAVEKQAFEIALKAITKELQTTFGNLDPNLTVEWELVNVPTKAMPKDDQQAFIQALERAHNGVFAMSAQMPDLVETSNNIARVTLKNGAVEVACLTRSSVAEGKSTLAGLLKQSFEAIGLEVIFSGDYPGWQPNPDSAILGVLESTYKRLFNEEPRVVACHAGLECGILGRNYPNMDMISFGPTILGAHSPEERVQITSVKKFWTFLLTVLLEIPVGKNTF